MFCSKCGRENFDSAKKCVNCGADLATNAYSAQNDGKSGKKGLSALGIVGVCVPAVIILVILGVAVHKSTEKRLDKYAEVKEKVIEEIDEKVEEKLEEKLEEKQSSSNEKMTESSDDEVIVPDAKYSSSFIMSKNDESDITSIKPSVEDYSIDEDFRNVINIEDYRWRDEDFFEKLRGNGFAVEDGNGREFFEGYEMNRYLQRPNFVTVDSMMHTYHLYFAYLLRNVEKKYLIDELSELLSNMLVESYDQYEQCIGTEFEEAAFRNVAFFAVPCVLLDEGAKFPEPVKEIVANEYDKIVAAEGIDICEITDDYEDYSQYKPRGYYEGDKDLEKYFRAMMWCGRIQFNQEVEDMDKSALLMTLAINDGNYEKWDSIYAITSFFAGASDDPGYPEYMSLVDRVYEDADIANVAENIEKWNEFHELSAKLSAPKINSTVIDDAEDSNNVILGYRFMGQRFTIDAKIMQNLVYSRVGEYKDDDKRMLPDVLDVPAALGSKTAYEILKKNGETSYKNYDENLEELKKEFTDDEAEVWSKSLYSGWLHTLKPILDEKSEGYPMFMQTEAWKKKNLETFAGSYTELKHDTILYSKQIMAEMGGGDEEGKDFRGYVEPEPLVFSRFENLANNTKEGLDSYGYLTKEDGENLDRLAKLAKQLKTISIKELTNESLSDDEHELIECYGGEIEHFWLDAMKQITGEEYPNSDNYPAALVVDVATDPNGSVLELGTGDPACIYVVVPVDGKLRIATGSVYSFYQFEQPINDRLTDSQWRKKLGVEIDSYEDPFPAMEDIPHPDWAEEYRYEYSYR